MAFTKIEPFFTKAASKKKEFALNSWKIWKVLLMIIIGCLSVALIVAIVLIIIFAAGIFPTVLT